jgi:hypothetical protein
MVISAPSALVQVNVSSIRAIRPQNACPIGLQKAGMAALALLTAPYER